MGNANLDLSVVIITCNEEANIERCLMSVPKGAEVIIVDSGSTDRTCEIAESFGARVVQRDFTSFSEQKNIACSYATRSWILSLDADEALDLNLQGEICAICNEPDIPRTVSGFRLKRRLVFMGRVMRYGKTTDFPVRLFRRGTCSFEGMVHERLNIPAHNTARLKKGCLFHYSYTDLTDYFNRFNRYTSAIAHEHLRESKKVRIITHIFRPWFEFIFRYFILLGFLDGYAGYTYALISSLYAYIKYSKLYEFDMNVKG